MFLACGCDKEGAESQQCGLDDGKCSCKQNFDPDTACSQCKDGNYMKGKGHCQGQ